MKVLSPEAMRPSSLPKTTIKSTSLNPQIHSFLLHRSISAFAPDGYVRAILTRPGHESTRTIRPLLKHDTNASVPSSKAGWQTIF